MWRLRVWISLAAASFLLFGANAQAADPGALIKGSGPAVYYADSGRRYVFPNDKVYFSWYKDFNGVRAVTDAELASYLIGGNVTYRPGARLVKIQSDPKVYAVSAGGSLRWVASEDAAKALYGGDWSKKIDDVSDAFFFSYRPGDPVYSSADFDASKDLAVAAIADDLAARNGKPVSKASVAVRSGNWSDPAVWGGTKPPVGAQVTVPAGISVVYDLDLPDALGSLDVAGALTFWDQKPLRLAARLIRVSGTFAVGSEDAPLRQDMTDVIILSGEGMKVDGGRLELHGSRTAVAWTHLAASAKKGDRRVALDTAVGWPVGAEVSLASSATDTAQTETRTIASIDGGILLLDKPLAFDHAVEEGISPEAALLTRNLRVLGAPIVISGQRSAVKIEGVEFRDGGQADIAGRSPINFNGVTDASSSYLRGSVIRDSTNRCLDIRYSSGLDVEDNVALSVRGGCFVLETGAETGLTFKRNLVMTVKADGSGAKPAAFLIRNPGTVLEGNAVVGSGGYGYWYVLPDEIARLNGVKLRPREQALASFKDNAVRGAGSTGLFVDDVEGKTNYAPPSKAVFSGLRAAFSGDYGFWIRGSNVEVSGAVLAANRIGGSLAAFAGSFRDSTVIGNPDSASSTPTSRRGFVFYDGPVSVSGVAFRNFVGAKDKPASALAFRESADGLEDARSSFRGLTFLNARAWQQTEPKTVWDRMAVVRDLDAGKALAAHADFIDDGCVYDAAANLRNCPGPYAPLEVAFRDTIDAKSVSLERTDTGASVTLVTGQGFDGAYADFNVKEGQTYRLMPGNSRQFSLDYGGGSMPLTVSFKAGAKVQASSDGVLSYDPSTGMAALTLAPKTDVSISW